MINGRNSTGENVNQIQETGQSAAAVARVMHTNWANSSSHRSNMLNGSFSEVGIGIVKANGGTQVITG